MKGWMAALENIVWLTQLGLSVLLPPVLCLWLAWWLVDAKGAPYWIYLPALVLGLGGGGKNFAAFCKMMQKKAGKPPRTSFNRH